MDGDTCKTIQIYSPRFSYSIDIRVGQAAPEIGVESGYCLTDQQKKEKEHKVLQMQEQKKIAVSRHTEMLVRLNFEHQETLQGSQVPTSCSLAHNIRRIAIYVLYSRSN